MRACAEHVYGTPTLGGRRVAVQGVGQVGAKLARLLADEGAVLLLADVDAPRVGRLAGELGAETASPRDIAAADVDVFAPCALGDAVNTTNVDTPPIACNSAV